MCQYRITKKQYRKALAEIEAEQRDLRAAITRDTFTPVGEIVARFYEVIKEHILLRRRYARDCQLHREGCKRRYRPRDT